MPGTRPHALRIPLFLAFAACSLAEASDAPAPAELPPAFKHGTASVDDLTLAWADRPGRSPALVLLPGTFNDCRVYAQVVTRLDPHRRTIIVEHAGHGESGPAIGEASVERSAAHVTGVLDQLQVDPCFVGGHSLGGMVAMEAARQCPERFRGVISIEGWTNSRAAEAAFDGDMKSTLSPDMRSRIDAHRHENASRWPPQQQSGFVRVWTKWDGTGFLRDTNLPVLELYGDRSKSRPAAEVLGIPDRENIRLQWIPNASHWLPVEKPADVAAAIEAFMGGVEGPSR